MCPASSKSGETEASALGSPLKSQNVVCKFHSSLSFLKESIVVGNFLLMTPHCAKKGMAYGGLSAIDFPTYYHAPLLGLAFTWGAIIS